MPSNKEIEITLTLKDEASKRLQSARASIKEFSNATKDTVAPILQLRQAWVKAGLAIGFTVGTISKGISEVVNLRKEIDQLNASAIKLGVTSKELSQRMYGIDLTTANIRIGTGQTAAMVEQAQSDWARFWGGVASTWGHITKTWRTSLVMSQANPGAAELNESDWKKANKIAEYQLLNEDRQRRGRSKEGIAAEAELRQRTNQLTMSQSEFRKSAVREDMMAALSTGVDATKVHQYYLAETKRAEEDRTKEIKKQQANRLKSEGDTLGAMRIEQENALAEFKRMYGEDGEMVTEFTRAQDAMYKQAKNAFWGIKAEFQIFHDAYTSMVNSMTSTFSDVFYNTITGQMSNLKDVFRNFGQSIIRILSDIAAEYVKNMIIMGIVKGIGSLSGGSAGTIRGGVGGTTTQTAQFGTTWSPSTYHRGGVIRAHGGLAVDEVPIIAQSGEGVISRRGMSAIGRRNFDRINRGEGASGVTINIQPIFQLWDASDVNRNKDLLISAVSQAITNNAQIRKIIKEYG